MFSDIDSPILEEAIGDISEEHFLSIVIIVIKDPNHSMLID